MQGTVAGIDLTAKPSKRTWICIISKDRLARCFYAHSNNEILEKIYAWRPLVVAIDAPLTLKDRGFRDVEIKMLKSGYKLLPLGFPGMRELARRAIELRYRLEIEDITVIETHPTSSFKNICCNNDLVNCLTKYVRLETIMSWLSVSKTKDLGDSLVSALTALFYLKGETLVFKGTDGEIHLLPRICSNH